MGPSGAGKSTLARLALGLLSPTQGEVRLAGLSTQRTPFSRLADIGGLVLQDPLQQLLATRVDDELRLGLRELLPDERRQRVDDLLAAFGLEEVRARHPLALSEGQRRRVALAAVLARRPRVLVLDEPTLGQDERQGFALAALLARLAAEGTAVLAISHNPELVNDACDRVMLLSGGRLLADLPMHLAGDAPEQLAEAGLPLADVPATVRELARLGSGLRARRVEDLVAQLT
jgi:energy-coupling factor transport system ATP-binding protein